MEGPTNGHDARRARAFAPARRRVAGTAVVTPDEVGAELRLQLARDAAQLGYWDYRPTTGALVWDEACCAVFGITPADFGGTLADFDLRIHPDDLPHCHDVIAATGPGQSMEISYRVVLPDGGVRHVLSRGQALSADGQTVDHLVGVVLDVTALHQALAGEQRSAERLEGLARVALAMATVRDDDDLTRVVLEHGVGVLGADGAAVCVRDDARGVLRVAISDDFSESIKLDYAEMPLDGPLPGSVTARTGDPIFLSDRAAGLAFAPEMAAAYDDAGREAWACLPLRSADRLLGSLIVSWLDPREFGADDRELLSAFAAQAAQALDRIQTLAAEERRASEAERLTEVLQRSLLTLPPQPDHLQVAVRYAPAAQEAAAGGDWYDAFLTPDGALCLVIGDCVGHDRQAAASMATVRNLLRGTAYAIDDTPAGILRALDKTMAGLEVDALATALLARIEQGPELEAQGLRRLVWSNAGHLPPVLRLADGTTHLLSGRHEAMLGIAPASERSDQHVELPEGCLLLLFTDGLVERRTEDIDAGLERLRQVVADVGHLPLEEVCEQVTRQLLGPDVEDDVALLALRVHAEVPAGGAAAGSRHAEGSIQLRPDPVSAPTARRFVTDLLERAGRTRWVEATELATSEVVTNAVLHGHTPFTLTVVVGEHQVRVEVRDDNPALPTARHYDRQATTGRGMAMVAAVSSDHGVRSLGTHGKVVWFTVADVAGSGDEPGVDDLLAAWADDEGWDPPGEGTDATGEQAPTVLLRALPPTLWLAAQQHHDALLRELALSDAEVPDGRPSLRSADRARATVSQALERALTEAHHRGDVDDVLPRSHPAELPSLPRSVDLALVVAADGGADFAVLQDVLDLAERLATDDLIFSRPGLPEIVAVRDWVCEQVIAQLSGIVPAPWGGADADHFATEAPSDDDESTLVTDLSAILAAPTWTIAVDEGNRIVAVSQALADELGWAVGDLVGRRTVVLIPPRFREAHVAGFTRHLTTGEARALEIPLDLPVLRRDGTEATFTFLIHARTTTVGDRFYEAKLTPVGAPAEEPAPPA